MRIITGNTALRQCIPNTLATAAGEPTWYEKIFPFLEEAEMWLAARITGDNVLDDLKNEQDIQPVKQICARIITAQALMGAIPSLDLVLTPNGFGIVNTQNVVPASKDRIERLIASVEAMRDNAIDQILFKMPTWPGWLETPQGRFFASTLFPRLTVCRRLAVREHLYDKYLELHGKITKIEAVLAETYFSEEQMDAFRLIVVKQRSESHVVMDTIQRIQSLVIMLASDMQVHQQSFFDLVQTIRDNPQLFPEWHASKTAELYAPPVFINKKESNGYWF